MKKTILILAFIMSTIISCQGQNSAKLNFKIPNETFILDSVNINASGKSLKIIILEKKKLQNINNAQHNSNKIIILNNVNGKFQKFKENDKLIFASDDNCPSIGYGRIVAKNSYFTIEQIYCADFLFVKSYTTFKMDETTGDIFLHKYGEEYTNRSNPDEKINSKIWTKKDFGNLKFEAVTEDSILKITQNKPKK